MPNPLSSLMGGMGGAQSNPMMSMLMSLMSGKANPEQMIQQLIGQNPQLAEVWKQAQTMSSGKSSNELQSMIEQLCKQKGVDFNQFKSIYILPRIICSWQ